LKFRVLLDSVRMCQFKTEAVILGSAGFADHRFRPGTVVFTVAGYLKNKLDHRFRPGTVVFAVTRHL
jgi:hypothetical protein